MNKFVLAFVSIIIAALIYPYFKASPGDEIGFEDTLAGQFALGLARKANETPPAYHRVAIGYNSNLDLIVKAKDVFENLRLDFSSVALRDKAQLSSLQDLQETFAYYLSTGSAAERYVSDQSVFQAIINAAVSSENKIYHLGGNAGLMANRFALEGCDVLLGGVVGGRLRPLLHPSVRIARDVLAAVTPQDQVKQVTDEIHLILEYERESRWGVLQAPRANRFIVVKDETNAAVATLEELHEAMPMFNPSLVVISGLHLLEGQPEAFRTKRVGEIVAAVEAIPHHEHGTDVHEDPQGGQSEPPVHLELASIGSVVFMQELGASVAPVVDSLGLNEQELGSLYVALGGVAVPATEFRAPKVGSVVTALGYILQKLGAWKAPHARAGQRRLSRVHFHCLTFHMVAQRTDSGWTTGAASVAAGSLACSRQACEMRSVDVLMPSAFEVPAIRAVGEIDETDAAASASEIAKRFTLDGAHPVAEWQDGEWTFYVAPVLVCRRPEKTVGLGDAISAVGLLHHQRL